MSTIVKLNTSDLPALQEDLDTLSNDGLRDPFARSAAYFGMTGRNGLWKYDDGESRALIARHPNKENTILIFPPHSYNDQGAYINHSASVIRNVIDDENFPEGEVEIPRIPKKGKRGYHSLPQASAKVEETLDWVYPVHIVDPRKMAAHEGPEYNNLRSKYNAAVNGGLRIEPIGLKSGETLSMDTSEDIRSLVNEWSISKRSNPNFPYTHEDLTTPTESLLRLMRNGNPLSIGGVIVRDQENQPLGFWLWQELKEHKQAASLARVSIGHLRGISGSAEFGAVKMAQALQFAGIEQMCLGGSETEGLNGFKEKMGPVDSIELDTIFIDFKDDVPTTMAVLQNSSPSLWNKIMSTAQQPFEGKKIVPNNIAPASKFGW